MNETACNYNPAATIPGLCNTPEDTFGQLFLEGWKRIVIDNDLDNDGVCDGDEISGYVPIKMYDFNSDATEMKMDRVLIRKSITTVMVYV